MHHAEAVEERGLRRKEERERNHAYLSARLVWNGDALVGMGTALEKRVDQPFAIP
jgi:hypothetical protein